MNGKPEFLPEYVSPKQDPLAPTHLDFDFEAVEMALGEIKSESDGRAAAAFIRAVFAFVPDFEVTNRASQAIAGRRFLALAWVLDPSLFDTSPSAGKLAEMLEMKCVSHFYRLTGEASRKFGLTNRAQAHAWNRGKHAG